MGHDLHNLMNDVVVFENFANNLYLAPDLILQVNMICEKIRKKDQVLIFGTTSPHLILDYLEQKVLTK